MMGSKRSDQLSSSGPPRLLGVGARPSSVDQVAMATGHGRRFSERTNVPGWLTRDGTLEEPCWKGQTVETVPRGQEAGSSSVNPMPGVIMVQEL